MRRYSARLGVLVLAAVLLGCSGGTDKRQRDLSGRVIKVVTTTGMIGDLVSNIGGARVTVTSLMGPGVDPHLYKASERDVSRLADADLIVYNGLHLEGAMVEVLEQMSHTRHTLAVGEHLADSLLLSPPEFSGAHDPHIWFDVSLWMIAAEAVRDKFIEIDQANTDLYRVNAVAYLAQLSELHQYMLDRVQEIPADLRVMITAHDAFNYFGRAYGLEVRGLQGISTATEAGTADVQALARFIAERRVPAIFVESSVPPRSIEAVQAAVRAQGFNVQIGGELFSDAMGDPDKPEGKYLGMVRHNIDTITDALAGINTETDGR